MHVNETAESRKLREFFEDIENDCPLRGMRVIDMANGLIEEETEKLSRIAFADFCEIHIVMRQLSVSGA